MTYSTTAFLEGLAANAAQHVPEIVYNSDMSAYEDAELGVYFDRQSQVSTGQVVLTEYPVSDDPSLSFGTVAVQFYIEAQGDTVRAISDALFDHFHGTMALILGGVKVVQAHRRSAANLGQNGEGRVSRTENYYFQTHRPSKNRT